MDKKKYMLIFLTGILMLVLAAVMDATNKTITDTNKVSRNEMGDGQKEVQLVLDAEGILEHYAYSVVVEEQIPTKQEVEELFSLAKEEIQATFYAKGEDASHVTNRVYLQDSYVDGKVDAQWYFSDYEKISPDGILQDEMLEEQGTILTARAELECGEYSQLYDFPIQVFPKDLSNQEQLLLLVRKEIEKRLLKPGEKELSLPQEINGIALNWSNHKKHTIWKVLLMEVLLLIMTPFVRAEKAKKKQKERHRQLLLEYPDMVSKLAVLIGSGMSVKQAWNRISARYFADRQKGMTQEQLVYTEMRKTSREMEAGESERIAYQKFGERIGLQSYYRFIRILISNLQKGNAGLCELLQRESEDAFEQRKMLAKKMGEEATTKMLFPLILMMGIVMAIIIAPAIIGFIW